MVCRRKIRRLDNNDQNHQASYSVLRSTAASLLSPAAAAAAGQLGPSQQLCPRAALDFLSACVHIPRLWQGRDQRPPKHDRPVDVLQLQGEAIVSLVEFVVRSLQISRVSLVFQTVGIERKPFWSKLMTSSCVQRGHRDRGPRRGRGAGQGRSPAALLSTDEKVKYFWLKCNIFIVIR